MDPAHLQAAEALEAVARAVAEWTVDQIHTDDPDMEIRYGGDSRRMWRHEVQSRVAHLVEALAADRSAIFTAHASWSRAAFMARDMGEQDVERSLHALKQVVRENLPADIVRRAEPMIDAALSETKNKVMPPPSELDRLADEGTLSRLYLLELLQRDREKAERIVREQLEGGATLAEILTRIISPAMQEIGRMWHMQEASIADEHYCTAATQAIMARLRGQARRKPANGLVAVACSAGGDMHELGIRMVSDLLDAQAALPSSRALARRLRLSPRLDDAYGEWLLLQGDPAAGQRVRELERQLRSPRAPGGHAHTPSPPAPSPPTP